MTFAPVATVWFRIATLTLPVPLLLVVAFGTEAFDGVAFPSGVVVAFVGDS